MTVILEDARHRLLRKIARLGDVHLHPNPTGRHNAHDLVSHHDCAV